MPRSSALRIFLVVLLARNAAVAADPILHFRSGFEGGTTIINQTDDGADIIGIDASVAAPNDWGSHLEADPIGSFSLQYEDGDSSQRLASLEADPLDTGNRVLRFWIKHPNVLFTGGAKARIQANLYNNTADGLREFSYAVRICFHPDWQKLVDWNDNGSGPSPGWCIISEFWNNANWLDTQYPFRIHTTVERNPSGKPPGLYLAASSAEGQPPNEIKRVCPQTLFSCIIACKMAVDPNEDWREMC